MSDIKANVKIQIDKSEFLKIKRNILIYIIAQDGIKR